jgi:hypothetical protein
VLIENMRAKHEVKRPGMQCMSYNLQDFHPLYTKLSLGLEMDVRSLTFENESFDVVIDKGMS